MRQYPLALLLAAALAAPAFSADYYVVVPMKGRQLAPPGEPQDEFTMSLFAAPLPVGIIGELYAHELSAHLQIIGDSSFDPSLVSWEADTALPPSFYLSQEGVLSGSPSEAVNADITVSATYKSKSAQQTYHLSVQGVTGIVLQENYRSWADGSYAQSCYAYREPVSGHSYSGSTGDGIYRIQPPGQPATNVYCDMSNGGYTLLAKAEARNAASSWVGAVGGLGVTASPSPSAAATFKYSDTFMTAVPKSVYKVASIAGYPRTRYWSGSCPYSQSAPTQAECWTSYADEALTSGLRVGGYSASWGGLHDGIPGPGGLYIVTSLPRDVPYGWAAGGGTAGNDTGTGGAGTAVTLIIWAK